MISKAKISGKTILVVGSSNTDVVIKTLYLPVPGETVLGDALFVNPGGKGANQAVAAARLGGNVSFICKTGNDVFGRQCKQLFEGEGINTSYMVSDVKASSGMAMITVDRNAENCIVVAPGANSMLAPKDLKEASELIEQSEIILMQLEIPIETVEFVARLAHAKGVKVVLDPAPVCQLSNALLKNIDVITPNKIEASMLSGVNVTDRKSAINAAKIIKEKGVGTVIIKLGKDGALVHYEDKFIDVSAPDVKAIDTTGAGDVFNGALAVALANGLSMPEAADFSCLASAISVTKFGSQSSAPNKSEVESFYKKQYSSDKILLDTDILFKNAVPSWKEKRAYKYQKIAN